MDYKNLNRTSIPDAEESIYLDPRINAEQDEFDDYITSQENNKNYVDIYRREHCKINRLSLMVWGDSKAGKTSLVDRFTNSTHSKSKNNHSLRIVECVVSKTETGNTWNIPKDPFYQRVYQEFLVKFSPESSVYQSRSVIHDLEMKIWEVSKDYGAYNSHKLFLAPSSVCLLVLNVGNGLHEGGPVESTRSPLESLDHWLHMIDMCASNDINEYHSECAIIVLTHTDLIDEAQRERKIEEYKKEIIAHVQSKHTCKYVHPTVFALGDHNMHDNELYRLQNIVVEKFESNPCEGTGGMPWSWLKLEAGIQKFFVEKDRRYLSLKQLVFTVRKSYGMSMEDLKLFLQFHLRYRNLIFDKSALGILDSVCNTKGAFHMITDPLLIDEAFSVVTSLWDQTNLTETSLHLQRRIDLDAKQYLIALSTLEYLCKLNNINVAGVTDLANLLTNFNLLIPQRNLDENHAERKYIVPVVMSSFVGDPVYNIFREPVNLRPLIYWFDQSPDLQYKKVSGFNMSDLFCKLVSFWKEIKINTKAFHQPWKMLHMHSDAAAFRCGPRGQFLVHVTCQSCAIVVKLACIPNSRPANAGNLIPQIRWFIEGGIQVVVEDIFPGLQCSVCVSPCDAIRFECLSRLGDVGSDIDQLEFAICAIHGKTLDPNTFSRWFCFDSKQENLQSESSKLRQQQKDIKKLKKLSRNIGNKSTLESSALALYVTPQQVDRRMTDSHRDFEGATFDVLYRDWYLRDDKFLTEGSPKLTKLQSAMDEVSLGVYK